MVKKRQTNILPLLCKDHKIFIVNRRNEINIQVKDKNGKQSDYAITLKDGQIIDIPTEIRYKIISNIIIF